MDLGYKLYLPCFRNAGESYQTSPKISNCCKGMCAFEFCDATNTFLKVCIKYTLGGIHNVSKVALAINLKKKKVSPFSFHDHVYHGFYSCCSDTWVLVTEVIPYNLLDVSDS